MTIHNLRIDADRLWASLMEMARIGGTARGGCNRQALTDLDREGRNLFVRWAKEAGCSISVDQVGNIFARRPGEVMDAAPVFAGSHLDTQATGGKFDGVYGVLAGLEVVRALNDAGIRTERPIEIAVWTNEEGCRFVPAMLGSGVVSGVYSTDFAHDVRAKDGARFGDELERIGYLGDRPAVASEYAAMYEAHIEQGPILEAEKRTIGVVTGIQGAYWFDVELTGASVHAGPTPMAMRRDPWRAAAPIVSGALAIAEAHAPWGRATIGDARVEPGARNTVPERVILSIDIRHPDHDTLEEMVTELRALIRDRAAAANVKSNVTEVWHMPATRFDDRLVAGIDAVADSLGYSAMRIVSGAGHDSLHTAQFAPTAMIFVPCAGGISHNEAESADAGDLAAGANVLLHAMLRSAAIGEAALDGAMAAC